MRAHGASRAHLDIACGFGGGAFALTCFFLFFLFMHASNIFPTFFVVWGCTERRDVHYFYPERYSHSRVAEWQESSRTESLRPPKYREVK